MGKTETKKKKVILVGFEPTVILYTVTQRSYNWTKHWTTLSFVAISIISSFVFDNKHTFNAKKKKKKINK